MRRHIAAVAVPEHAIHEDGELAGRRRDIRRVRCPYIGA